MVTRKIFVDVIVPVHNAADTVEPAVRSAMHQCMPKTLESSFDGHSIHVTVCCFDDGSCDESWSVLKRLKDGYLEPRSPTKDDDSVAIPSDLLIGKSSCKTGRGAGYARNQAVQLGERHRKDSGGSLCTEESALVFLCLLDSDDVMHPNRIAEQVSCLLSMDDEQRHRTILGCNFDRDPPDSTWHYAKWANDLTDERIMLERFREVTILQPTWMLCHSRWKQLGGYIEAPPCGDQIKTTGENDNNRNAEESTAESATDPHPTQRKSTSSHVSLQQRLIHPTIDTPQSLKLAEDLRFYHEHLLADGVCKIHKTEMPLVTYRHTGTSQSFRTSRKLLLALRVLAFERAVLRRDSVWQQCGGSFVIWGAGRDGKDVYKALSAESQQRVYCFVDVDEKKINEGYYVNRAVGAKVPIVHFSLISRDAAMCQQLRETWESGCDDNAIFGKVNKGKPAAVLPVSDEKGGCDMKRPASTPTPTAANGGNKGPPKKKRKTHTTRPSDIDLSLLPRLPVLVCVAMYRTNGALEKNVRNVGRIEGKDLYHFS